MIVHRWLRLTSIALLIAAASPAAVPQARAQQAFERFVPLLVDLPGWTGKKADGVAMQMPGNNMITASRDYQRGNAHLTAQVIVGAAAQGALATIKTGMKFETSDGRMSTSTIDGMPVMQTYSMKDKSGASMVALASNAVMNVSFRALAEDEALTLARKFNWKAI